MRAIDISGWPADEEHPFFPEGSRDKRLLRCPDPAPHTGLIAGHRYLFKKSRTTYPAQFWAEVVAYQVGVATGVPVPPAYPAWDSRNSECAALIEWFYGKPGDDWQGYLPGGWFMKASIKDYDFKRGTQHNFGTIEGWCMLLSVTRLLSKNRVGLNTDWEMGWARVLTFDALIGNTDRHHENWGFLMTRTGNPPEIRLQLAPAFDNGTSLGHERPESQFQRFEQARYLQGYIRKGHHHMRLHQHDPKQAGFAELLLNLVKKYPQSQSAIDAVLHFDTGKLTAAVMELTQLELPVPLSEARARFMLRLVLARRDALLEALS